MKKEDDEDDAELFQKSNLNQEAKKYNYPDSEQYGAEHKLLRRFRKILDKEGPYNICCFE